MPMVEFLEFKGVLAMLAGGSPASDGTNLFLVGAPCAGIELPVASGLEFLCGFDEISNNTGSKV